MTRQGLDATLKRWSDRSRLRSNVWVVLGVITLEVGVAFVDYRVTEAFDFGYVYVALVLLGLWARDSGTTVWFALLGSSIILSKVALADAEHWPLVEWANLLLLLSAVWFTALAVLWLKESWFQEHLMESAQQRTEQELARTEKLLSSISSILIGLDTRGTIIRWNATAEDTFEQPAAHTVGRTLADCGLKTLDACIRDQLVHPAADHEGRIFEFTRQDGTPRLVAFTCHRSTDGCLLLLGRDITERERGKRELKRLAAAVESAVNGIIITDAEGVIVYVNSAVEKQTGYTESEILGNTPGLFKSGCHDRAFYERLWETIRAGGVWSGRIKNRDKAGEIYEVEMQISPVFDDNGEILNYVAVQRDLSHERALELQLQQAQKLEAIGQLAAGIAHEINTPTQFVGDNLRFLKDGFADLARWRREVERFLEGPSVGDGPGLEALRRFAAEIDLPYLDAEIPHAIEQSLEGVHRVATIVQAMKVFSHPGVSDLAAVDLNECLQSTITVARNEWKYHAEMQTAFDPDLPLIECNPGEMNQVFLNIIVNAAHGIADARQDDGGKGTITIHTSHDDKCVEIRIADTGTGIPPEVRDRIFDPFFTTKDVGKGSGQGLAIAHNVVHKHGGTIEVESEWGAGTTFVIRLPRERDSSTKLEDRSDAHLVRG